MQIRGRLNTRRAYVARWLAVVAMLCGVGLAAGPEAQADITGNSGQTIFTMIALSGSVNPPGSTYNPTGWTPPSCWLEPNSGQGFTQAYTPADFQKYMDALAALLTSTNETATKDALHQIYWAGKGADAIVGITNPPYNLGLTNGMWYMIACSSNANYGIYTAFKSSLGITNDAEEWFWLKNGTAPTGVPVADPEMLAELAAANTRVSPGWPDFSPALQSTTQRQTVNLETMVANPAGSNGFTQYTARATLQSTGQFSEVYAYPDRMVLTSSGPISPSSVHCTFSAGNYGALNTPCGFTFLQSTPAGTSFTLTEQTWWKVVWGGDPVTGQAGWTREIGPFTQTSGPITVQEIQSVVGN